MKPITTLTFLLFMLICNGQQKTKAKIANKLSPTALTIKNIDSLVLANIQDSNVVYKKIQGLGKDLYKLFPKQYNTKKPLPKDSLYTTMQAYWLHGKLIKLSLSSDIVIRSEFGENYDIVSIYFLHDKPVLLQQDLSSCSIMGTCGHVRSTFHHYFNDTAAFAGQQMGSTTGYALCYGWYLEKPNAAMFFNQVNDLRKLLVAKASQVDFEPPFNQSSKTMKIDMVALYASMNKRDNEIVDHYGY